MAFVRLLSRRVSSTALGAALGGTTLSGVALCNEDHIPPILVGFDHEGPLQAFDAKAVRRTSWLAANLRGHNQPV